MQLKQNTVNLRFGDLHTPFRMLHRALGKTDLEVSGAHLFSSLSTDLPHKTEGEEKRLFNSYLTNPYQIASKVFLVHGRWRKKWR